MALNAQALPEAVNAHMTRPKDALHKRDVREGEASSAPNAQIAKSNLSMFSAKRHRTPFLNTLNKPLKISSRLKNKNIAESGWY